jgi:hypothetical protein
MTELRNMSTYELARHYEALGKQLEQVQGALSVIGGMWEQEAHAAAEALGPLTGRIMAQIREASQELRRRG